MMAWTQTRDAMTKLIQIFYISLTVHLVTILC